MNPQLLPATARDDVPVWQQTVVAFLAEKERRSGSRRTVETYARMLWPFLLRVGSPDLIWKDMSRGGAGCDGGQVLATMITLICAGQPGRCRMTVSRHRAASN